MSLGFLRWIIAIGMVLDAVYVSADHIRAGDDIFAAMNLIAALGLAFLLIRLHWGYKGESK